VEEEVKFPEATVLIAVTRRCCYMRTDATAYGLQPTWCLFLMQLDSLLKKIIDPENHLMLFKKIRRLYLENN
jgi:hypothetical protein